MRITNGMMINNSLNNLNGALTRVARYNNQLASNRKILTLSDSPVGVLNSLGARNQIRRLEQYQRNVDNSRAWIQQSESAVTEMEELTHSIRELLTDAMGTENAEDKKIFATQMRQYTNSLFELCNSSNGAQFMFGGYNVTKQPFTAVRDANGNITQVLYNGLDLSGLNVSGDPKDLNAPPIKNDAGAEIVKDIAWGGKMTAEGSYTIQSAKAIQNADNEWIIEVELKREPTDNGSTPVTEGAGTTYKATLNVTDMYSKYASEEPSAWANKTMTGELVFEDADGKKISFGSISWQNTDKLSAGSDKGVTEDDIKKIAEGIAANIETNVKDKNDRVVSTSVANAAATVGSKAPDGLTWTGSIPDTTQKYPISVGKDAGQNTVLNFTNAYGSPYHTVSNAELGKMLTGTSTDGSTGMIPAAVGDNITLADNTSVPNNTYVLNLEEYGLGTVSITTKALYDMGLKVPPGVDELAQGIASAEFVASAVGNEANQHIQFEVGHNIMTDVTFTGIELVGTGENNLFNMMIDLANLLDNNADNGVLTSYITKITQQQDRLLTAVVKSGNRTIKMDTMVSRYKLDAINYEAKRSNIEDIDQAEVIMQMKYSEAIYKQALAASAQIIQPTLMDFLR